MKQIKYFEKRYPRAVGARDTLQALAQKLGQPWFQAYTRQPPPPKAC